MKIFMTGGTGFVGKTITKTLTGKGHQVTVLTRDITKGPSLPKGATYLEGNPTEKGAWQDRVADHEVVIDDTSHALSAAVIYNTPTSSHIPASWFHVGDLVGYLKNGNNEIISLWRIP